MTAINDSRAAEVLADAHQIDKDLRAIRRLVRAGVEADIMRSGLTEPQVAVLDVLASADGLAISDLAGRVQLAHSTTSGIVDRLAAMGLVRRVVDPVDRRRSQVEMTEAVRSYVDGISAMAGSPIRDALLLASQEERLTIARGVGRLRSLLEAAAAAGPQEAGSESSPSSDRCSSSS